MNNSKLSVYLLLQKASDFRDCKELIEFYMDNICTLRKYTIINATDCIESMDLYSVFDDALRLRSKCIHLLLMEK